MPYRSALCAFVLAFVVAVPPARAQAVYQFDLPRQPLADTLRAIAAKDGANILFDSKDVNGIEAPSLHAELSTDDAIKQALTGTGLKADSTTLGTVVIRPIEHDKYSASYSDLQEVVVSARRKEELLAAVPASITAYTSDFLQRQNIQDFVDYATRIPNVTFQCGQQAVGLWGDSRATTIRGVAGVGTTAYYVNDTPHRAPAECTVYPCTPQPRVAGRASVRYPPASRWFGAGATRNRGVIGVEQGVAGQPRIDSATPMSPVTSSDR